MASMQNFGVLAIKIDEKEDESGTTPENSRSVAEAIVTLYETELCLVGQLDENIFACLFPEKDTESCLKTASHLQKSILKIGDNTVSIGIAVFPTISFTKDQIMENALKAIDHAAFFGANSVVVFDSVSLNISGDHFYQQGDMKKALEEFTAALDLDPNNVNVHNSLGVCYGMMGDFEKAASHFETAISLDPEDEMAWYNSGLVYKLKQDYKKALDYFSKACSLNGDRFEVAYQTGKTYLEIGEREKGEALFEKAITLNPETGPSFRFLGECYAEIHMIDDAISAYKKAIKENPHDAVSLSALGSLFDQKGENPEISVLFCQQSVDISPENGLFRHRLGRIYMKLDKLQDAMTEFKAAVELGFDASKDVEELETLINSRP